MLLCGNVPVYWLELPLICLCGLIKLLNTCSSESQEKENEDIVSYSTGYANKLTLMCAPVHTIPFKVTPLSLGSQCLFMTASSSIRDHFILQHDWCRHRLTVREKKSVLLGNQWLVETSHWNIITFHLVCVCVFEDCWFVSPVALCVLSDRSGYRGPCTGWIK